MVITRYLFEINQSFAVMKLVLDVSENDVSLSLNKDQTNETKKYVACLIVGENELEKKLKYEPEIEQKYQKNMTRSNSSVTKISNWRKNNHEENLFCESSRV